MFEKRVPLKIYQKSLPPWMSSMYLSLNTSTVDLIHLLLQLTLLPVPSISEGAIVHLAIQEQRPWN